MTTEADRTEGGVDYISKEQRDPTMDMSPRALSFPPPSAGSTAFWFLWFNGIAVYRVSLQRISPPVLDASLALANKLCLQMASRSALETTRGPSRVEPRENIWKLWDVSLTLVHFLRVFLLTP